MSSENCLLQIEINGRFLIETGHAKNMACSISNMNISIRSVLQVHCLDSVLPSLVPFLNYMSSASFSI